MGLLRLLGFGIASIISSCSDEIFKQKSVDYSCNNNSPVYYDCHGKIYSMKTGEKVYEYTEPETGRTYYKSLKTGDYVAEIGEGEAGRERRNNDYYRKRAIKEGKLGTFESHKYNPSPFGQEFRVEIKTGIPYKFKFDKEYTGKIYKIFRCRLRMKYPTVCEVYEEIEITKEEYNNLWRTIMDKILFDYQMR